MIMKKRYPKKNFNVNFSSDKKMKIYDIMSIVIIIIIIISL